ncbi:fimbrial protein [Pseudomonas faucium]|uniref:fimbrial protein n=1 Tax=Pseudomonas faucium TaxID=2740518 RepID=UPI001F43B7F0|nr:fimbrial protein [Pseudomonas faucium]
MKKILAPLALVFASSTALAAETGTINFYGTVTDAGPCPIEVVDPTTGVPSRVVLGHPRTGQFQSVGDSTTEARFALKVSPGGACTIIPNTMVKVTFDSQGGAVGPGNNLYRLMPGSTPDLGVAIFDDGDNKLAPGTESMEYLVDHQVDTLMPFYARYEAIKVPVTPGSALANVGFTVDLP